MNIARQRNAVQYYQLGQLIEQLKKEFTKYEPPAPGPTGVPILDKIYHHPAGKAVMIGSLSAAMARTFPNAFWTPLVAGTVVAIMIPGLVPGLKREIA